jgi:hypothetical protein
LYKATAQVLNQSIATSTITQAQLVEVEDPNGNFASYEYTVPITGWYNLAVYDYWTVTVAGERYSHIIHPANWQSGHSNKADTVSNSTNKLAKLTKGDTLNVEVYHTHGSTRAVDEVSFGISFVGV